MKASVLCDVGRLEVRDIPRPVISLFEVLVEPLACIIHSSDAVAKTSTRHTVNSDSADRRVRGVLICGAGPAGCLFTQYLRKLLGYEGFLFRERSKRAQATTREKPRRG